MGKRIISQARGKGGLTYRVRKKAYRYSVKYPRNVGEAVILEIIHSAGHTAPLMKLKINNEIFYNPAFDGAIVGNKLSVSADNANIGNVVTLKNLPIGTQVYNIERNPGDGGKMIRTAGSKATVSKTYGKNIGVIMPNKKEIKLNGGCRATVGIIAGDGRIHKPFVTAGKKYFKMKARNKLWPRTSAIKVNAIDHPFGSGRGKRAKPKIAKRNAPPGRRVGHLRPRRTGHKR